MDNLYNFIVAHLGLFLFLWTSVWQLFNWVFTAYASSLRAPTAQSTQNYVSWFAIVNSVAGNLSRVSPPKVENSPNFESAVIKRINGGTSTPHQ